MKTLAIRGESVSLAAISCDHVGNVGTNGDLFTSLFVFVTNCFHVVPMCLMTWAKVIQVRSSVLGVASSFKKSRWGK